MPPRQSLFSWKPLCLLLVLGAVLAVSPVVAAPADDVAQTTGAPLAVVKALLGHVTDTMGDASIVLEGKARDYLDLKDRWGRFHTDNRDVRRHRQKAERALEAGRFQDALGHLKDAFQKTTDPREQAHILSQQADVIRLIPSEASYRQAADLYAQAAGLVQDLDAQAAWTYRVLQGDTLSDLGVNFWDRDALGAAVALLKDVLQTQEGATDPTTKTRIRAQAALGRALFSLGELGEGPQGQEAAVIALRAALDGMDRDQTPLTWAATQNTLGHVLYRLGEIQEEPDRLEEAVVAFRAALTVLNRDHTPKAWAGTQAFLGSTLTLLGERETDTRRLKEAQAAYQTVLEVWTRDQAPLEWAMIQTSLGVTLWRLGDRDGRPDLKEEALAAHQAALKVFQDQDQEFGVDLVEKNLRNTQGVIGDSLPAATASLVDEVSRTRGVPKAVLRAVLVEVDEKNVDVFLVLDAKAREYLAFRHRWGTIPAGTPDGRELREEVVRFLEDGRFEDAQIRLAAAAWKARDPQEKAQIRSHQADVIRLVPGLETRARAARLYAKAADLVQDTDPQTARTYRLLQAETLSAIGDRFGNHRSNLDRQSLETAISLLREILQTLDRTTNPKDWVRAQTALGTALCDLGESKWSILPLEDAVVALRAALEGMTRD